MNNIIEKLDEHTVEITEIKKLLEIQNANIFDVKRHGEKVLNAINWDHLGKDITSGVAAGVAYELERIDATAHTLIQNAQYLETASQAHIDATAEIFAFNHSNSKNLGKAQNTHPKSRDILLILCVIFTAANLLFGLYYSYTGSQNSYVSQQIQSSSNPIDTCKEYGFDLYINPDDGLNFCIFHLPE